jgi:hypothetical protein
MRTQMIDGNSQSDVTPEDLEELSRPPKHTKTAHLFGQCQKVSGWCETAENYCCRFFRVEICPSSKVSRLGYSKETVTQELVRQGERIHRDVSHTGPRRNPSNQDETGSVLKIR